MDPEFLSPKRARAIALCLFGLLVTLLIHSAWRVGPTYDEHFYITSGLAYFEDGDFSINREHPPLLKLLMAAPIWCLWKIGLLDLVWPTHGTNTLGYQAALIYQLNLDLRDVLIFLGRLPMICLTLWMVVSIWRYARRRFGQSAGLAAILLAGFNPGVLANGHIAGLDAGVTALIFIATLAFIELMEAPSAKRALKAGLLFGLANLAKSTALLLVPMTFIVVLVAMVRARQLGLFKWAPVVWFVGLGVFSIGYGFQTKSINEAWGNRILVANIPNDPVERTDLDDEYAAMYQTLGQIVVSDDHSGLEALYRDFERFTAATRSTRYSAIRGLLRDPSDELLEVRLDVLQQLTGRSFATLDNWRDWQQTNGEAALALELFTQPILDSLAYGVFGMQTPIPFYTAIKGLDFNMAHAKRGHTTYYMGEPLFGTRDFKDGNPHPEYNAHILAIKNPLSFLALFVVGLFLARKLGWSSIEAAGLIGFPALLFYIFSSSNMLMGMRYILPLVPFMALTGAAVGKLYPRVTLGAAALFSLPVLAAHPHELMYYNFIGGGNDLRNGGPFVSSISDDWGQATRAVGQYFVENRQALEALGGFYYAPISPASPLAFGLECKPAVPTGVQGIVAVHTINYWRDSSNPKTKQRNYAWLDKLEPFDVIDESVYLFDTRKRATGEDPVKAFTSSR